MDKIIQGKIVEQNILQVEKNKYYHYTKAIYASKIFGNQQFKLSYFSGMNDTTDTRPNSFIMCFCTKASESIPLWFLYSGIKGDGLRISFTQKTINKIKDGNFYTINEEGIKEIINPHKVILQHVLYYENHVSSDKGYRKYYKIKIDGSVFYVTKKQLDEFKANNPGLYKLMEWDYEKEVRLVVDVVDKDCDKLKKQGVYFDISKYKTGLTVKKGPNAKEWNDMLFSNILRYYGTHNIQKLKCSELAGTIKMGLCKDCTWNDFKNLRNCN